MSSKLKSQKLNSIDVMMAAEQSERCLSRSKNIPLPKGTKVTSVTFAKEGWEAAASAWEVARNLAEENLKLQNVIINFQILALKSKQNKEG